MWEARQRRIKAFTSSIFANEQKSELSPNRSGFAHDRYNQRSAIFDFTAECNYTTKPEPHRRARSASPAGINVPKEHIVDVRTRDIPTYRSTVFTQPSENRRSHSQHKIEDHTPADYWGSEDPQYYKKSKINCVESPAFSPRYAPHNARRSKSQELYGVDPTDHGKQKKLLPSDMTITTNRFTPPKKANLLQAGWKKHRRMETQPEGAKPAMRGNDFRRVQVENQNEPASETVIRRTQRNYSSIFGQEQSSQLSARPLPEIPLPYPQNAQERKAHHLTSHMDVVQKPRQCLTPPPRFTPREDLSPSVMKIQSLHPQGTPYKREEQAVVDSFDLTGLGPADTVQTIKQRCKGMHIVELATEQDSFQGHCTGRAKISFRHYPSRQQVQKFTSEMNKLGYKVESKEKPNIRKPAEAVRKSLSNAFSNPGLRAHEEKISQRDLFGCSERVNNPIPANRREERITQREGAAMDWQRVPTKRSFSPNFGVNKILDPNSSLLKATIASTMRSKH